MQEQDTNLAGEATVCGQVALPGADGHEHCTEDDGDLSGKKVFSVHSVQSYISRANNKRMV